jgi:flagellar motility protein MotE (MotC chaperone)
MIRSSRLQKVFFSVALLLAGASLNGGSALSQAVAVGGQVTDEIREFCSNIADAAKDRRYALQVQELETLKKDIDRRVAQLEAKRAEYETWLKRREEFMANAERGVVEIYSKMKPDAAAERLSDVEPMLAAAILMKLNTRQAGFILNEMNRKAAAELTGIMAAASRPQDPT